MKSRDVLIVEELSKEIGAPIELFYTTDKREKELASKVDMATFELTQSVSIFNIYTDYDGSRSSGSLAIVDGQGRVVRLYLNRVSTLTFIPESLFTLVDLQLLCLFKHELLEYISPKISFLQNLQLIFLGSLQIKALPSEIVSLPHLKHLIYSGSGLSSPPQKIAEQGLDAIKNYFESVEIGDITYLYEAKMVMVGRGFAGKTSLVRKLTRPGYQLEKNLKSTEGIGIDTWDIELPLKNSDSFRFNIWDFAGQEKYDATHQFFITERTLYLFVTEARQESNFLDFDYWLNIVQLLGNGSPVIVVQNKTDLRCKKLPTEKYKQLFPNIVDFVDVSCKDGNEATIDNLLEQIRAGIRKLPQVGDELPKAWVDIRQELEAKKESHHISYQQYVEICADHDLTAKQADFLSQYFHDLGIIVHYQKDPLLKKMVVIDPDWVVDAVYNVLDTPAVEQNNGKFCHQDLEDIWQDDKYKDKLPELLAIMNRYELCFQLGNSGDIYRARITTRQPQSIQADRT